MTSSTRWHVIAEAIRGESWLRAKHATELPRRTWHALAGQR